MMLASGAIILMILRKRRPKSKNDIAYKRVTTTEPVEEIEM
jgi:hypothetical protein